MAFIYTVKKGDTLNKIAQQYGFSNYKDAGVSSVPSGNFDLISEGQNITLNNYDPNKVSGIQTGSPVVSSNDNVQTFKDNSNELDGILGSLADKTGNETIKKEETTKTEFNVNKEGQVETGDPVLDKLNSWEAEQRKSFEAETEQRKSDYEKLFQTNLSAIDATANATTQRINASYAKRIDEQRRINDLNIARVKAYGLGNGGQYTPISYGDAVTNREQEASDKVTSLENERNSLIAQAESARLAGQSKALSEKMTAIFDINKELRESLARVEKEAETQYQLLRDLRKEEETKHKEAVDTMVKRLTSIAPQYLDEYEQMDDEEKNKFIQKIATQTGVDYATVYGIMQGASSSVADSALKTKKTEADIKAVEALANQRNASAFKDRNSTKEEENMDKDVPDTFKDDTEFQSKRQEFVKKYGTKGASYWDDVFDKDSVGDYTYTKTGEKATGSTKERAESAGYDYDAMSKEFSDEEIEKALQEAGV